MTPEDRLRQAIAARTSHVDPSADALHRIEEKLMETQRDDHRKRLLIGLGSAAAVIAVVVGALALTGDDEEPVATDDSSTTTTEGTTTTESTTTTTEAPTTTTLPFAVVDPATPVFPDPETSQRFDDPVALVDVFARGPLGFSDPIVSAFQQGDTRSGEVEVRSFAAGDPTVVLVRLLEDDTWFVVGAETGSIQMASPAAGDAISSPQPLTGQAYAFEGTVNVYLFADGEVAPIGETFVTGRGDGVLGDFTGELTFTLPAGADFGTLHLVSSGGEDGGTIAAQVVRVRF